MSDIPVYCFDDRMLLPYHFNAFLVLNSYHTHVNFITNAHSIVSRYGFLLSLQDYHNITLISLQSLHNLSFAEALFDSLFHNYSTNPFKFERSCFLRWFALDMASRSFDSDDFICLLDTDCIVGCNLSDLYMNLMSNSDFHQVDLILDSTSSKAFGPYITIIKKSTLHQFCTFLLTDYFAISSQNVRKAEYYNHLSHGLSGGLCDMTALRDFSRKYNVRMLNVADAFNGHGIANFNNFKEHRCNHPDSFISLGKTILFFNGLSEIKVPFVHFQGNSKRYLEKLDCPRGDNISCALYLSNPMHKRNPFYEYSKRIITKIHLVFQKLSHSIRHPF